MNPIWSTIKPGQWVRSFQHWGRGAQCVVFVQVEEFLKDQEVRINYRYTSHSAAWVNTWGPYTNFWNNAAHSSRLEYTLMGGE